MNNYKFKERQNTPTTKQEDNCCCPICGKSCPTDNMDELLTTLFDLFDEISEDLFGISRDQEPGIDESDLVEAIEEHAAAVAYGEQLLVWVPFDRLEDFLFPLFDEYLDQHDLDATLDDETLMLDLTKLCHHYDMDIPGIYYATDM